MEHFLIVKTLQRMCELQGRLLVFLVGWLWIFFVCPAQLGAQRFQAQRTRFGSFRGINQELPLSKTKNAL